MNQRNKRSSDRKATMATGGHIVHHARGEEPEIRIQKATGDVKPSGLAKASPFFKPIEAGLEKPQSTEEEKKVIASATEKILEKEKKSEAKWCLPPFLEPSATQT